MERRSLIISSTEMFSKGHDKDDNNDEEEEEDEEEVEEEERYMGLGTV